MMNNRGFTLTELMVAIVIISILIGVAGYSMRGRMMGYRVENQVKGMYADLMNARARAMQRNRSHFIQVTAANYQIFEDTNENGVYDAGIDNPIWPIAKPLEYTPSWTNTIIMDTRGLVSNNVTPLGATIIFNIGSNVTDYDCIVLSTTRINIGKMEGVDCVVK